MKNIQHLSEIVEHYERWTITTKHYQREVSNRIDLDVYQQEKLILFYEESLTDYLAKIEALGEAIEALMEVISEDSYRIERRINADCTDAMKFRKVKK
jgi:hypothetical protein